MVAPLDDPTDLTNRFGRMISAGCRPVQWLLRAPYPSHWQRQLAINPSTIAFPGDVHVTQHETDDHQRFHISQPRQLSCMTILAIADFARLHGLRVDIEVDQELSCLLVIWSRLQQRAKRRKAIAVPVMAAPAYIKVDLAA